MKFSGLVLVSLVAATQASPVAKIVKGIFSRSELDALTQQTSAAIIGGYVTKIKANAVPIGLVNALKSGGCNPPVRKQRRSLDDFSEVDVLLARAEKTPAQKAMARQLASNPASLPAPIKNALKEAGWTGSCTDGAGPAPAAPGAAGRKGKRSFDLDFDEFEFDARDLELEDLELLARDYESDGDFFYSE